MQQRMTSEWHRSSSPETAPRRRVVIEDPGAPWFEDFARYRARGFEVAVCPGPEFGGCPLTCGETCELVENADVMLCALDPRDAGSRTVLRLHRDARGQRPLVVRVPRHGFGDDDLFAGLDLVTEDATVDECVRALRHALDPNRDRWGVTSG